MKSEIVKQACIIDDDPIYVSLVKKIIDNKKLCSNLLVFENGKQSMDYLETLLENEDEDNIPEIIFLDLNMPIMDGWEFLENFARINNNLNKLITLYVVSSSINPFDIDRAKSIPSVTDYLTKPITIEALERIFLKSA